MNCASFLWLLLPRFARSDFNTEHGAAIISALSLELKQPWVVMDTVANAVESGAALPKYPMPSAAPTTAAPSATRPPTASPTARGEVGCVDAEDAILELSGGYTCAQLQGWGQCDTTLCATCSSAGAGLCDATCGFCGDGDGGPSSSPVPTVEAPSGACTDSLVETYGYSCDVAITAGTTCETLGSLCCATCSMSPTAAPMASPTFTPFNFSSIANEVDISMIQRSLFSAVKATGCYYMSATFINAKKIGYGAIAASSGLETGASFFYNEVFIDLDTGGMCDEWSADGIVAPCLVAYNADSITGLPGLPMGGVALPGINIRAYETEACRFVRN